MKKYNYTKEDIDAFNMPSVEFTNEHGEYFKIEYTPLAVYLSGDEVDHLHNSKGKIGGRVFLFNNNFTVWSPDELEKLGEALIKLSTQLKK